MSEQSYKKIFFLVQLAAISVFLGRAYQHIFWDAPFRTLLWDEQWMSGIVGAITGLSWESYITNINIDDGIQLFIKGTGYFYLLCAILCLLIKRIPAWLRSILWLGIFSLIFLALLYCKEKFFSIGQFFEYSLQFLSPLLLLLLSKQAVQSYKPTKRQIQLLLAGAALTFICHGLYAINYYPQPGNFVQMTINILACSEESAKQFLQAAAILDFLAAALILIPGKPRLLGLAYMVFWGFATAAARIWAHFDITETVASFHQWGFEALYRFPHFVLPLALLFYFKQQNSVNFVGNYNPKTEGI